VEDSLIDRLATLRIGCPVEFKDRWQGSLQSFELDEDWEVLNVAVKRGILHWKSNVRLPFSLAQSWSDEGLHLSCTSAEAFGRQIPPVAAPARPLSAHTPLAIPGARLAGALVKGKVRRMEEAILNVGGVHHRIPVSNLAFEGKVLRLLAQLDAIAIYVPDGELVEAVKHELARDPFLIVDELRLLRVGASAGIVTLSGNVRTRQVRERIEAVARSVPGVIAVENRISDDVQLELEIGRALNREGLQHAADLYVRCNLGEATLFGRAPSLRVIDYAVRTASALPGVRSVKSRLEVGTGSETRTAAGISA
jgi:osmotically-inducible protein OsmY